LTSQLPERVHCTGNKMSMFGVAVVMLATVCARKRGVPSCVAIPHEAGIFFRRRSPNEKCGISVNAGPHFKRNGCHSAVVRTTLSGVVWTRGGNLATSGDKHWGTQGNSGRARPGITGRRHADTCSKSLWEFRSQKEPVSHASEATTIVLSPMKTTLTDLLIHALVRASDHPRSLHPLYYRASESDAR